MSYLPSAGAAASSVVILTLSTAGIPSNATNGLEWGATAPAGATGQAAAIQAKLDAAVAAALGLGARASAWCGTWPWCWKTRCS